MNDDLLVYYERELRFLRQLGAEFADKYPKIAGRLVLEDDKCEDPHVERLIEAFAFLAGRIHRKLDDELPEITESMLNVLYPHYLAPIPSMAVVQFVTNSDQALLQTGQTIPRESMLSSRSGEGTACRFRTCYPVTIWPIEVTSAHFEPPARVGAIGDDTRSVLRMELRVFGGLPFSELREKISRTEERVINRLRFHLHGDAQMAYGLYELLLNNVLRVEMRGANQKKTDSSVVLPPGSLRAVGFERDEGMFPYRERSFMGYRLVQEYFTFPDKFLFIELCDLDRAVDAALGDSVSVSIYLNREFSLEKGLQAQTFRLNCTPIVNLFRQIAEPISLSYRKSEYRVVPDVRLPSAMEVYSIDEVRRTAPYDQKPTIFHPFYSFKYCAGGAEPRTFWHASRRQSERREDKGTEMYISLVDLDFNPVLPEIETLTVTTTCTNRDLPLRLPFGRPQGDFQLEGVGLFTCIRCLSKPTPTIRPPLRRAAEWRLISHLSLNYLSLIEREQGKGPEALRQILKLYDFADSAATRRHIAGITRVEARRVFRTLGAVLASGFVRGLEVSIEFDEQQFVGSGAFLFAAVLERFFGMYTSINSFVEVVASMQQREGVVKRWPARAGEQIVL